MNKCKNCLTETKSPFYCSRRCAAQTNGRLFPKRKRKVLYCTVCGVDTGKPRIKRCQDHTTYLRSSGTKRNFSDLTFGELRTTFLKTGQHRTAMYTVVRRAGLYSNKHLKDLPCAKCGYAKHVEICHIRPLHKFKDEETVGSCNSPANVIQFCCNCHWEFDNLTAEEFGSVDSGTYR